MDSGYEGTITVLFVLVILLNFLHSCGVYTPLGS
jgi:hypothetical protein